MKTLVALVSAMLTISGVHAATPPEPTSNPHMEKYTLAPGSVVNVLDPHEVIETSPRSSDVLEEFELDPPSVTPATIPIDSGNHTSHREGHTQSRDRLGRATCPELTPWTCDGKTCFNRFTHNCCKGGHVCEDPMLCIKNIAGQIACK